MSAGERTARPRASVFSVLGELLITAGVIALLFVAWQLWIGDLIIGSQRTSEASALSEQWAHDPVPAPTSSADSGSMGEDGDIPVLAQPQHGDVFAIMKIPRFGPSWEFKVAVGTTRPDILDKGEIGFYPTSVMPGDLGNTVVAAHRWTSGAPFGTMDTLHIGDAIVIETKDGWYTYRFRNLEYVQATQVDVLLPVPQRPTVAANGRYLTLTSCAPKFNMLERIIGYALFESYTPRANGAPTSVTAKAAP